MQNLKRQILCAGLAGLCLLAIVGCSSSNLEARRQAHPADYAALNPAEKASVDRGRLQPGMTTNAVLLAWGQPTIISSISTPNGPYIVWEYYRKTTLAQQPSAGKVIVPGSPTPVPYSRVSPEAPPPPRVVEFLDRSAVFHQDKLVNWDPR
ncbi:MAG TPA: hypothetical protein VKY92_24685 [Verrucomicrobiae bacterium]|nr:hypothetical protein [Verrucomicrobiae bacterium]